MQLVSYRNTEANLKRIVPDQPEQINPRYLKGRDRLIAMSREYERRQAERKAAEEARQERIREIVARDKAAWAEQMKSLAPKAQAPAHYQEVIAAVAFWHGLSPQDIYRHCRAHKIVAARHDAMAAVWLNCTLQGRPPTLVSMGQAFKRDHTTCLAALIKMGIK